MKMSVERQRIAISELIRLLQIFFPNFRREFSIACLRHFIRKISGLFSKASTAKMMNIISDKNLQSIPHIWGKNSVMIWLICNSLPLYAHVHMLIAILTRNKRCKSIPKQYVFGVHQRLDCASKNLDTVYSLSLI